MLFRNFNNLMMFSPDKDAGSNNNNSTENVTENVTNNVTENVTKDVEKTYTQTLKSVNSVYKDLGFESESDMKDFIDKYKKQEEANKSELVKEQEKSKRLEAEKAEEIEKVKNLQYKFDAISGGCNVNSVDDVVTLIKSKLSEDKNFETVLNEIKDQYPMMFNTETKNITTGGGGTVPRKKSNNDISGMGKRLAEQRKQNNSIANNNNYFQ